MPRFVQVAKTSQIPENGVHSGRKVAWVRLWPSMNRGIETPRADMPTVYSSARFHTAWVVLTHSPIVAVRPTAGIRFVAMFVYDRQ